ncbi:hypothetical protein DL770_005612 [Monosporascus sp. CRB-9-2]|nr:hypothetical protein DL770_005612 [Monosporascus sp. CRB-9-2]
MTSNPEWGKRTSGLEVAKVFAKQIEGRNVLITGVAPGGVGEGTAVAFASQRPKNLLLVSRTPKNIEAVASSIRAQYPEVSVKVIIMDLASQASIRKAAAAVAEVIDTLDILINNAGATYLHRQWTAEEIEIQFGANHIGPFLFTKLLFPLLEAAASSSLPGSTRIINLSSNGHRLSPVRFHDYNFEGKEIPEEERPFPNLPPAFAKVHDDGYMPTIAYAQSKTANVLFTVYLQKHLKPRGIASYAVHPGCRQHDEEMANAISKVSEYWMTIDEGAATSLVAALDPKLSDCRGLYMSNCQFSGAADFAEDYETATRLWHLSEELIGEKFTIE